MQPNHDSSRDLPRTTLGVLFLGVLTVSTLWIMLPFLQALLWATMIVISTWPLMLSVQSRLGGRRGAAAAVMAIALLLVLVIPLTLAIGALISNIDGGLARFEVLKDFEVPPAPDWLAGMPVLGPRLSGDWEQLHAAGPGALTAKLSPYAGDALRWLAARIGGIGGMILQFLLIVIISVILYMNGETAASGVRKFAFRLAGQNGEQAAVLAAATIRGVAFAVLVTAIVQTALAAAGLLIASVPGAWLLVALVLVLNLAQLGPWLVMIPAVTWKFYSGDTVWGFVLLAFALVAGTIDNLIRPVLIKRGADLPLVLIFAGVIGGIISLGFMGIFIGPVILAVSYELVSSWVNRTGERKAGA